MGQPVRLARIVRGRPLINGPAVGQYRVGHSGGAASVASPAKTELAVEIRAPAGGGGDPLAGAGGVGWCAGWWSGCGPVKAMPDPSQKPVRSLTVADEPEAGLLSSACRVAVVSRVSLVAACLLSSSVLVAGCWRRAGWPSCCKRTSSRPSGPPGWCSKGQLRGPATAL